MVCLCIFVPPKLKIEIKILKQAQLEAAPIPQPGECRGRAGGQGGLGKVEVDPSSLALVLA